MAAGRGASSKLTTVETMMAGALAGSATVLITNPIWVVNTRMTARKVGSDDKTLPGGGGKGRPRRPPSTLGTLVRLLREEGPAALFAGVLPALVLVINPILQYTIFDRLKNWLENRRRVTPTDAFYLGAVAKLLATTITYPYITVKSRAHVAAKDAPREGMIQSLREIIRQEGWIGLYNGLYIYSPPPPQTNPFLFRVSSEVTSEAKIQESIGIGPKVSQSVLTAAFLFAFKDVLYDLTMAARRKSTAIRV